MTLLELLRQELPKRGGWPKGAVWVSHLHDFLKKEKLIFIGDYLGSYFEDWDGNRVTREQYEATGWDGTNLPPVGVECEIKFLKYTPPAEWFSFKLIEVHDEIVIITLDGENKWQHISKLSPDKVTFRPLRTEAERAIDEMVRLSGVSIGAAKILYDAGYRK